MLDSIKQRIHHFKSTLPSLGRSKTTPKDYPLFMQGAQNVLYSKREAPTGKETQHWVSRLVHRQKPPAKEWLAGMVEAQSRLDGRTAPVGLSLHRTPPQLGEPLHTAAAEAPPVELSEPVPPATATQEQIVQGAVDDYVKACKENPAVRPAKGAVADLLTFARTGFAYKNAHGFHSEPRNRIGDQQFGNRFAALEFLVKHTNLLQQLKEVAPSQAQAIVNLHRELGQTEKKHRYHGAGL